jgi:hypothetical protein
MTPSPGPPQGPPLAVVPSKRKRPLVGCLVALGLFGLVGLPVAFLALWQILQPSERLGVGKKVEIEGCEDAQLMVHGLDAAPSERPPYFLTCWSKKAAPPACEDVMRKYVSANGPLSADVRVSSQYLGHTPVTQCTREFHGDGTPR